MTVIQFSQYCLKLIILFEKTLVSEIIGHYLNVLKLAHIDYVFSQIGISGKVFLPCSRSCQLEGLFDLHVNHSRAITEKFFFNNYFLTSNTIIIILGKKDFFPFSGLYLWLDDCCLIFFLAEFRTQFSEIVIIWLMKTYFWW